MAKLAKPTVNLSTQQIDVAIGKARYERSKAFHASLHALAARVAKIFGSVNTGHGTPATS